MARPPWTARQADVAGALIVVLLGGWLALGAGTGGGDRPEPVLALLAGLVTAVVAGRLLADRSVPVAGPVAAAVAATFALTYPSLLSAAGAPTGYANANATLAAVGTLAAAAAARAALPGTRRQGWVLVAAALAAATAATGSVAGAAALVAGAGVAAVGVRPHRSPAVPVAGLLIVLVVVGVTGAVASGGAAGVRAGDELRSDLWVGAAELARGEPLRGLGVGAFEERNPVTSDPDLRWVHHEYLEVAVEAGAPGLLLVLVLAAWVAVRLWSATADPAAVVTAAAVATVVGLHGAVDHVWHHPAPLVLAAALFGAATRDPLPPHAPRPVTRQVVPDDPLS